MVVWMIKLIMGHDKESRSQVVTQSVEASALNPYCRAAGSNTAIDPLLFFGDVSLLLHRFALL